ncbi:MAG: pirin family protein [Prolixibacteraceae bacterium]|jgi:redox-sensitive bicupin YhaK (pirin superfamily)|nr:pirin family protein [Prolixibacteraceae bacterium]
MIIDDVRNIEPLGFQWKARDPFLFCVHHDDKFPKGNTKMGPDPSLLKGRQIGQDFTLKDGWRMYHGQTVPGFPSHPHRGFETITVVRKGFVDHTDSMKAAGRYGNGDVQWMTAGKGIQHAEMFPLLSQDEENPMELFQIWLNLPRKSKMVEPYFSMFWADTIPNYSHIDTNGKQTQVEIIVGSIENYNAPTPPPDSWANSKENEVAIWNIQMEEGAIWKLPKTASGINRTLYFYEGNKLLVGNTSIGKYKMADLTPETELQIIATEGNCKLLILQGKPIGEPVVQYGPFVMNTREEIQQTYDEYQRTQFGGWPWPVSDPVHDQKGRFAQHADGRIEERQ